MNRRRFFRNSDAGATAFLPASARVQSGIRGIKPLKVGGAKIFIVRVGGRCPVLVQLLTDQGVTGVGDAAVAYGTGAESAAAMIKELVHQFVLGKDPFAIVIRTFKWFLKMIPAPRWHQHIDGILY